jgi:hypothetical protein
MGHVIHMLEMDDLLCRDVCSTHLWTFLISSIY